MKKENKPLSFLKWLVLFFVVLVVIAQIYTGLVNPLTTDTVYPYESYIGYDTAGLVVRNETVVQGNGTGVLSYDVGDGGRVSKGGSIATVYPSNVDADNRIRVAELDKRIATLQRIQEYNDLNATDLSSINKSIRESIYNIVNNTQNGKVTATEYYDILLESMARKQIITGQASDFNALLTSLKAERDGLKASMQQTGRQIISPQSGYVIYSVDGFESSVKVDELEKLTVAEFKTVKQSEMPDDSVCKIVSDYEWYIVTTVPFDESLKLKTGNKVTLKTTLQSTPELSATVKYINKQSVGDETVVVFACNNMNNELAQIRNVDFTIVYEEYKGLKVDNRAIRFRDGKRGVYVLTASQVKFVQIDVLWSGENYSIISTELPKGEENRKLLRIYDEIIVRGKNLYDGKIVK